MKRVCAFDGCPNPGEWACDGGAILCEEHARAYLVSEDRADFADEYAREDRLERQREEREQFR